MNLSGLTFKGEKVFLPSEISRFCNLSNTFATALITNEPNFYEKGKDYYLLDATENKLLIEENNEILVRDNLKRSIHQVKRVFTISGFKKTYDRRSVSCTREFPYEIKQEQIEIPVQAELLEVEEKPQPKKIDEVSIKEYRGQRVITFKDIDEVHGRVSGTANRNFKQHKEKFQEGKHYFFVQGDEIRHLGLNSNFGAYLITEFGYMKLVKSLNDDLAWDVQEELVEGYFRTKQKTEHKIPTTFAEALRLAAEAEEAKEKLLLENKELKPKAKLAEDLLAADTLVSMEEMAKMLGDIGRNNLFAFLREKQVIQQLPKRLPYQRYVDSGHFEVFETPRKHTPHIYDTVTRITPKGQEYIHKLWDEYRKDQSIFGKVKKIFTKGKKVSTEDNYSM